MADIHIREINTSDRGNGTGIPFLAKCLAMQLKHGLSFINDDEDVNIYGTGDSVSDPDGANKQTYTDAEGKFISDNVGEDFTVSGFTDSNNNGTFEITDYVGPTQIKYVNAAGSAETAAASWQITVTNKSYFSYDDTGTNGELNVGGTGNFNFQDTTFNDFQAGDVGKYILTVDGTSPKNSTVLEITGRTSTSLITINFVSEATEYPDNNTSLTWYMFDPDTGVPDQDSEYFRVETPHANGWAVEVMRNQDSTRNGLKVRIAFDGNWAGSKISSYVYCGANNSNSIWGYASLSTEHINFAFHNSTTGHYGGFLVGNVDPADTGTGARAAGDGSLVALMGCTNSANSTWGNTTTYERLNLTDDVVGGYMWDEEEQAEVRCYALELTHQAVTNSLARDTSRQSSTRASHWDFVDGQPLVIDYNVTGRQFEFVGYMKGWYQCSSQVTVHNSETDIESGSSTANVRFHMYAGNAMSWPQITSQH